MARNYLGEWVSVLPLSGIDSGKEGYIIKLNAPFVPGVDPGDYDTPVPCHLVRFRDGERRVPVRRLVHATLGS